MSAQGPHSAPAPGGAPPATRSTGTIGKTVSIKGQVFSEEDLYLDGRIEGSIDLTKGRLTVGKSGRIQANIKAREVDVHGNVHGDIEVSGKVTIRTAANLVGNVKSATISIEDGAYFKGSIDIVRSAPVESARAPSPKPASAAPARPTPPTAGPATGGPPKA